MPLQTAVAIGRFELIDRLDSGGQANVWLGRGPDGALVAVRTLQPEQARAGHTSLLHEARLMARLRHPHILTLFDYGIIQEKAEQQEPSLVAGSPFLILERLSTKSLGKWHSPIDFMQLKSLLLQVLSALAHMHARGVVHGDLKPDNLLLCAEQLDAGIKITDFGAATDGVYTVSHSLTRDYAAPEQINGEPYGPGADLYAVGRLAHWLLARTLPAQGAPEVMLAHARISAQGIAWLARLLVTDPRERFRSAAEAAAALSDVQPLRARQTTPRQQVGLAPRAYPAVPATIPKVEPHDPRTTPDVRCLATPLFVGRDAALSRIWARLQESRAAPRVVLVTGPEGVGRAALVQRVVEAIHEAGVAKLLRAQFSPNRAPTEVLEALILPAERQGVKTSSAQDWHRQITQALAGSDDPLVLILEDVQWGGVALDLCRALVGQRPQLFVLLSAAAPLDHPLWREASADLIALKPLTTVEMGAVLDAFLPLQPELRQEIIDKSAGRPRMATLLVRALIEKRQLVWSQDRAALASGASLLVPEIRAIWRDALDRSVGAGRARRALWAAAALGPTVERQEWVALCARVLDGPIDIDVLIQQWKIASLIEEQRGALRLAGGQLWEALCQEAQEAGVWATYQRACAALTTSPARRGRHLLLSGEREAGVAQLLPLIEQHFLRTDYREIESLLAFIPPATVVTPQEVEVHIARARLALNQEKREEARQAATDAVLQALAVGDALQQARALRHLGQARRKAGREDRTALLEAEALVRWATERASAAEHGAEEQVRCLVERGTLLQMRGDYTEAINILDVARTRMAQLGDHIGLSSVTLEMSMVLQKAGQAPARALELAKEALSLARAQGRKAVVARACNTLAEALRHQGQPEDALTLYDEAIQIYQQQRSDKVWYPLMGRAYTWLELERYADAAPALQALVTQAEQGKKDDYAAICRLGLGLVAAVEGDRPQLVALVTAARPALLAMKQPEPVLRWALQQIRAHAGAGDAWDVLLIAVGGTTAVEE